MNINNFLMKKEEEIKTTLIVYEFEVYIYTRHSTMFIWYHFFFSKGGLHHWKGIGYMGNLIREMSVWAWIQHCCISNSFSWLHLHLQSTVMVTSASCNIFIHVLTYYIYRLFPAVFFNTTLNLGNKVESKRKNAKLN